MTFMAAGAMLVPLASPGVAAERSAPRVSAATADLSGVRVDEGTVELASSGGRVLIERAPFRLRFETADGATALESTDEVQQVPLAWLPLPERVPGGSTHLDLPPSYAPITFIVGHQTLLQYPGGFWSADILTGVTGGIEHALTDVVEVTPVGEGVELQVATTDPGRTATVSVQPDAHDTFAVRVRFDDPAGVAVTGASFVTDTDESFHGFGGRRNRTDQRGEVFHNWLEEFHQRPDQTELVMAVPPLDDRYQFPTGAQGAYYVQSSFVSSRPYAFWLERDEVSRWWMAADREDAWHVSAAASELDFVVAPGDPRDAVSRLTAITGRNPLPPAWAHGPGVSRAVEPFADPGTDYGETYAEDVLRDLDEIERYDLPIESFAIEGWPLLETAGRLDEVMTRMRELGLRPVSYFKPFIGGGRQTERPGLRDEAIEEGYVATTPTGQPFLFGSPVDPEGLATLLDVTKPDARDWYAARVRENLDLGFEGFMQDFGEQTFQQMHFADGSTGREMHNRYPVLYHQLTAETFADYVAEHPDREPWFYVRSGYTGRPGSAAYEPTSWGGDNTADWSRASGIGAVVPDMLNRGLGGAYGYATDIGGYIDTFGRPDAELLQRWAELGALLPVNRLHGSPVNGTHMPWEYGDETVEAYRATIELNRRARPLIRSLWQEAEATGAPIARPLWWHHPDDAEARVQEQQWLLGPDVLVAPVVEQGVTRWPVYFPAGCWEQEDGTGRFEGPGEHEVDAALGTLPYFVRCGTDPFAVAGSEDGRVPGPPVDRPGGPPASPPGPPADRPVGPSASSAARTLPATGAAIPSVLGGLALFAASRLRGPRRDGGPGDPRLQVGTRRSGRR